MRRANAQGDLVRLPGRAGQETLPDARRPLYRANHKAGLARSKMARRTHGQFSAEAKQDGALPRVAAGVQRDGRAVESLEGAAGLRQVLGPRDPHAFGDLGVGEELHNISGRTRPGGGIVAERRQSRLAATLLENTT
jgi:hypothetical protein